MRKREECVKVIELVVPKIFKKKRAKNCVEITELINNLEFSKE